MHSIGRPVSHQMGGGSPTLTRIEMVFSSMPVGICKLCHRSNVTLCLSHYLPKATFRAVREIGSARPVIIKNGISIQKDDQITAHMLCRECEERFSKNGETWMLEYANRADGFKLYDLVTAVKPE